VECKGGAPQRLRVTGELRGFPYGDAGLAAVLGRGPRGRRSRQAASIAVTTPAFSTLTRSPLAVGLTRERGHLLFNSVTQTSGIARPAGNGAQQVDRPCCRSTPSHTYNLTAIDQSKGQRGSAQWTITTLTASLSPQKASRA